MSVAFIAASPFIARALVALALAALAVLLARSWLAGVSKGDPLPTALPVRREIALLFVILAGALVMRTAGARAGFTAPFYFAETETPFVARMLRLGTLVSDWRRAFSNLDVVWVHDSPLTLPVAAAFQHVLGPSFHLPVLIGAFYGVAAVLLAWAVGRAAHSQAFGLLFAAFLAASPLQLVWSRLGGLWVACVPQVLLVLWCGYQAGGRRSGMLALVGGIVAWSSLYYYYAARVGIPFGFLALVVGARAARVPFLRLLVLASLWVLGLAAVYAALHRGTVTATFWPAYAGYVGNKGERSLADLIAQNVQQVRLMSWLSLQRYFLYDRAGFELRVRWLDWDVRSGGLALLPLVLLGIVGVAEAVRHPGRGLLWLGLAGAGLAVPVLSHPSARRFLVLDLAWCALAALGFMALLRSRIGRALPARAAPWVVAGVPALAAAWSFAAVVALNGVLSPRHGQLIPFGESGFGDGLTCLRCVAAAHAWQHDIADNAFVVLFENDLERENPTSPGGLPLYGKLAALIGGRTDNFIELYTLMRNFNKYPPDAVPYFNAGTTDFASFLIERIERAAPSVILWHFERPTQWERWFARRLVAAGGEATSFETPLAASGGLQVRTPWAGRARAFDILRELAAPWLHENVACPGLTRIGAARYPSSFPPLAIGGPSGAEPVDPADWVVASWFATRYRGVEVQQLLPIGTAVDWVDRRPERLHLLNRLGWDAVSDVASGGKSEHFLGFAQQEGLGCAAWVGSGWWVVNPATGTLRATDPGGDAMPAGHWTGIARSSEDEVVLADADQSLVTYDLRTRTETRRFPAAVWPSLRVSTGECAPVLAGDGWYGTFSNLTSVLSVYDREGRVVGHRRLDRLLALGDNRISAVAADGHRLAIGDDLTSQVVTFEVAFAPDCAGALEKRPDAQPSVHSGPSLSSKVLTTSSK